MAEDPIPLYLAPMPRLNSFSARIVPLTKEGKSFEAGRGDYLREFGTKVLADGKTVTCYIEAQSGQKFTARWECTKRSRATAIPYFAQFVHDGVGGDLWFFDRKRSAVLQGVDRNRYTFRAFKCAAEDSEGSAVPDDIGKLEVVIRKFDYDHSEDESSDDEDDKMELKEIERALRDKVNNDDSDDEDYDEGQAHEQHSVRQRGRKRRKGAGEQVQVHGRVGKKRRGGDREGREEQEGIHEVAEWREAKPRHTHMVHVSSHSQTLIRPSERHTSLDYIRQDAPPPDIDDNDSEDDILVRFIFIYTTMEKIESFTAEPQAREDRSPYSEAVNHRDIGEQEDAVGHRIVGHLEHAGGSDGVEDRAGAGDPDDEGACVKTEDDCNPLEEHGRHASQARCSAVAHDVKEEPQSSDDRERGYLASLFLPPPIKEEDLDPATRLELIEQRRRDALASFDAQIAAIRVAERGEAIKGGRDDPIEVDCD